MTAMLTEKRKRHDPCGHKEKRPQGDSEDSGLHKESGLGRNEAC